MTSSPEAENVRPQRTNEASGKPLPLDVAERVAAAMHTALAGDGDVDDLTQAALEASHHADIVAENERLRIALRQIHDLADGLLNDIEAEEAQA